MGVGIWPICQMPILHLEKTYQCRLTEREPVSVCDGVKIESHQGPGWHTISQVLLAHAALQGSLTSHQLFS